MSAKRQVAQVARRREEFYGIARYSAGIGAPAHETSVKRPKIALNTQSATMREFCPVSAPVSARTPAAVVEWLCDMHATRKQHGINMFDFLDMRAFATFPAPAVSVWMLTATADEYQEALLEMAKLLEREDAALGGRARQAWAGIDGEF